MILGAGLCATGCGLVCAEPADGPAETAAEMTAAAGQRAAPGFVVTPSITTLGTRMTPPAFTADGRAMQELSGVDYRLWLSHRRGAVGIGLGTLGYRQPAPDWRSDAPHMLVGASPVVSFGVRYRLSGESTIYADALGARGLPPELGGAYVNTKVGMEWKPARSRLGFEHGAIGMQFDSGYRLSLKARQGGFSLYLRGQF